MKRYQQLLFGNSIGHSKTINVFWLLFRIHTGLSIAIHAGWPKMKELSAPGWFAEQVAGLGFTFPSPEFWAAMASWGEFAGGILIAAGLFTRLASFQLAFQFFIIAFVWYDHPEPLTGMYFQQTLFWSFLLIAAGGSGLYSVDQWLIRRQYRKISKAAVRGAIVGLLLLTTIRADAQAIKLTDFKPLAGKWKGTLSYLDYSSNQQQVIPVNALIEMGDTNTFFIAFYYTEEPDQNSREEYKLVNGNSLNEKKLISYIRQADGSTKIIFESSGKDGNKQRDAIFHHLYIISPTRFSLTKMVRFEGEEAFFQRNCYEFIRW